jgi:hypothetical protein
MSAHLPEVNCKADVLAHTGEVVRIVGKYVAQDTRPHAFIQRTPDGKVARIYVIGALFLEDKTHIALSSRPPDELAMYDRKKVAIIGTLLAAEEVTPGMAQPLPAPRLRDIQSIELWSE